MPHKPDGYTIFCDDIRQEVGNKWSLMGIYGAELFVSEPFPFNMPRMGFHVVFKDDPRAPLKNLTLCIFLPGDPDDKPTYKAEIAGSEDQIPPPPDDLDPNARRTFAINIILNSLTLKETGKIKVRMLVDGQEVKLGTLRVRHAEPPSQAWPTF